MKIGRHFHSIISLSVGNFLPLSVIYPVSHSPISPSVSFSLAALPPLSLLLFVVTLCISTILLYTRLPLPLSTLLQHPFSPSSVIQRAGGGSLLWSDSYKILIGTRNMIARKKGGWNGVKRRDGEKIPIE